LLVTIGPPLLDWWFTPVATAGKPTTVPIWAWAAYSTVTTVAQFTYGVGERVKELESKLSNRKRARYIANKFGDLLAETPSFFTHLKVIDDAAVDDWMRRVEVLIDTTEELGPSYKGRFRNSSNIDYGPIPSEIEEFPERKPGWFKCKTAFARVNQFAEEFQRKAD
jgi:hypothetical protein